MASGCKKRVYRTMCETDNEHRKGRYGTTRYESNRKYGRSATKKKTQKGRASPSPTRTKKR